MQHANPYTNTVHYGNDINPSPPGEQDFCVMNVSVSVLSLSGIHVESKKKQTFFHKKQKSGSNSFDKGAIGSSCSSELEDNNVKAVVTFFKNSNSSDTFIASHLPSLPIRAIDGSNSLYHATWPKDFDPNGNELSTFNLSRLMKTDYSQQKYLGGARGKNIFVPEEIVLTIGLNKGTDMIALGSVSIFVTECEDIQVNLPVRLEALALQNGKKSKSTVIKPIKPTAFPKFPKTKYSLQNACLKILLRAELSQPSSTRYSHDGYDVMGMHRGGVHYDAHTGPTQTPNKTINPMLYNPNFTPGSSVGAVFPRYSSENNEIYVDDSSFDETYFDDTTTAYTYDTDISVSNGIFHIFLDRFSSLCSAFPESRNVKRRKNDDSFVTIDGYEDRRYITNHGSRSNDHRNTKKSVHRSRHFGDDQSYGPNSAHSVATQATQKIQNYRRDDDDYPSEDLENYQNDRITDRHS